MSPSNGRFLDHGFVWGVPERPTLATQVFVCGRRTNQNEEELNYLSTTVRVLFEAAEHENDAELYALLDDMNYLLNETLMGAQAKGETVMPSISAKLKQLNEREKTD
jgi:hypothetical protein